ncbi:MAG TPA: carboxymuconolactone decarboxylase family protein [Bryobacteraceae bacterium]|nr:carboxymuconolactone decarboxylase family protein [Bryobacteraceae bacterium]
MRVKILCASILLAALAGSQTKVTTNNLGLVGDRFQPLTYAAMTPEQKAMVDHMLAGERGNLAGPFNVLLRSPEMGDLGQQLGARMRFHNSLPPNVRETVVLLAGRWWMAQYEWTAHKRLALQEGVSPAVIDAIATGKRPTGLDPKLEAAYTFITELYKTRRVSDATFQAAKAQFGERGIVDMIGLSGWYDLVCKALDVDRYPLANGVPPELKPLANPFP